MRCHPGDEDDGSLFQRQTVYIIRIMNTEDRLRRKEESDFATERLCNRMGVKTVRRRKDKEAEMGMNGVGRLHLVVVVDLQLFLRRCLACHPQSNGRYSFWCRLGNRQPGHKALSIRRVFLSVGLRYRPLTTPSITPCVCVWSRPCTPS